MRFEVSINERGSLTLPVALRRALGLRPSDRLIIEQTEQGLLLRPAVLVPIELYTEERVAEFGADDAAIAAILPDLERRQPD